MPKGNTAKTATKVAKAAGSGHVWCPNCDHKIWTGNLVIWYLESLISYIRTTGLPVRLHKLGTFHVKRGALAWRSHHLVTKRFRDPKIQNKENGTR